MANAEHLDILKKGVEAWNDWRKKNPHIKPDLTGAYLTETSVEWSAPNGPALLDSRDLRRVDLTDALLSYSVLKGADLSSSKLIRADLGDANLRRAELRGADLREARLIHTNLTLANLIDAKLAGAIFWETVMDRANFTDAVGLENCRHGGPSVVDHRTLQKSGGLPTSFLRGCGLPDSLIEFLPRLQKKPTYYHSCFISYSSKDERFAKKLHKDLQEKHVRCWFALKDFKIGDEIRQRIDEAIAALDKLLVVLSESSLGSDWVKKEVETAFEKERKLGRAVLFPILLDEAVMATEKAWGADIRRMRHIGDFRDWENHDKYKEAFRKLMRDLLVGEGGRS